MPRHKIEKKKKLSAEFSESIQVPPRPVIPLGGAKALIPGAQEQFEKALKIWLENWEAAHLARLEKFMRLPAEYGLDPNNPECWFAVAWELANQHLTGMQIHTKKKSGAKTKWDAMQLAALYYDVQLSITQARRKRTVSEICQELTKHSRWKGLSKKTLENMHDKAAESPLVMMLEGMVRAHEGKISRTALAPLYAYLDEKSPKK